MWSIGVESEEQKMGDLGDTQTRTFLMCGWRYLAAKKTWNRWVLRWDLCETEYGGSDERWRQQCKGDTLDFMTSPSISQPHGHPRASPANQLHLWLEFGNTFLKRQGWDLLVVQGLRLWATNSGGLGLIPGQGTRSCMPQQRSKMPGATTTAQRSQIKQTKTSRVLRPTHNPTTVLAYSLPAL